MKDSGIYCIKHTATGRLYVGSAVCFYDRFKHHRSRLRRGVHHSKPLQNAWNKHGEATFTFEVIETVPVVDLITREQYYIDTLDPYFEFKRKRRDHMLGNQLNKGRKLSEEQKRQISERMKGNKYTLGRPLTEKQKQAISATHKGKPKSPETRERMRQAALNRSAEHRAKISAALKRRYATQ